MTKKAETPKAKVLIVGEDTVSDKIKDVLTKNHNVELVDTVKEEKTVKVEDLEILETEEAIQETTMSKEMAEFIHGMKQGQLPPEAKGKNQYVFHRETGRKLITFKEIMLNRKFAFEVWAKTEEYAREVFMKKTKWRKYKGNTPCPIPLEED